MYYDHVKHCPICGYGFTSRDFNEKEKVHKCQNCGFHFYHNMIPTCSVLIPRKDDPDTVLLTKRNMHPHKGKYDLPGGFFEYGETVEEGAKRELKEELGLDLELKGIIGVELNDYKYQQYNYQHTTIYFIAEAIEKPPGIADKHENSEVRFFDLDDLESNRGMFAFYGDLRLLEKYMAEGY
ncbi:NUDIX domain-containing protein [Candidatus Dojkabacteria bacterium]|nr:NUDIX domain-containing protein [Candidatus Dojkabacteria bacterium]